MILCLVGTFIKENNLKGSQEIELCSTSRFQCVLTEVTLKYIEHFLSSGREGRSSYCHSSHFSYCQFPCHISPYFFHFISEIHLSPFGSQGQHGYFFILFFYVVNNIQGCEEATILFALSAKITRCPNITAQQKQFWHNFKERSDFIPLHLWRDIFTFLSPHPAIKSMLSLFSAGSPCSMQVNSF